MSATKPRSAPSSRPSSWYRSRMRIAFRKLSDERHVLQIVRSDGQCEEVECETRSYLLHDLLHYAVETEAGLDGGFWGNLAKGKTLSDMNDRTGARMAAESVEMAAIEQIVGALTRATKGLAAEDVVAGFHRYMAALDSPVPLWLTVPFVLAVQERIRQLKGHWMATPYGESMDLEWRK